MKAGLYKGASKVKFEKVARPILKENELLVKVNYAGICGTDMMIYSGAHPRAEAPLVLGHEFVGEVEDPGKSNYKAGKTVAINPLINCNTCQPCLLGNYHICDNLKYLGIDCPGGFAEYIAVPIDNVFELDENINLQEGALLEPIAVAVHTVRRSKLKVGDTVAILGAGPIGILIALLAKQAGAEKVIITDISSYRLGIAKGYGFQVVNALEENVVKIIHEETNSNGADVVFEVAGGQVTVNQMIQAIKSQGEIMVVSVFKEAPKVNLAQMHFRELSLNTTRCFTKSDFVKAIKILSSHEIDFKQIISHILPLEEIEKGFDIMNKSEESMKVLFKP